MSKSIKDIAAIIKELKEFDEMKKALVKEIDELKAQAIEYLEEEGKDEVVTTEGKITYREVLSNRLDSTQLKKDHKDLYESYLKQSSSMRFTCN